MFSDTSDKKQGCSAGITEGAMPTKIIPEGEVSRGSDWSRNRSTTPYYGWICLLLECEHAASPELLLQIAVYCCLAVADLKHIPNRFIASVVLKVVRVS